MLLTSLVLSLMTVSASQAAPQSLLLSFGNDVCVDLMGEGASDEIDYSTDYKCPGLELSGQFNIHTDTAYSIGIDQKSGEDSWEEIQVIYNNSLLTLGQGSQTGDVWRDVKINSLDVLRAEWLISRSNRNSKPFALIFRQILFSSPGEIEKFHVVYLNQENSCLAGIASSYSKAKHLAMSLEKKNQVSCLKKAKFLN